MLTALFLGQHKHPHEKPTVVTLGLPSHYNLEDTNTVDKLITILAQDPDIISWNLIGYTQDELEAESIEQISSHKGITEYTTKLRCGMLQLPTELSSSPRNVYVNILSSGKNFYVKCPINVYIAFKETVSEFFLKFTGEGANVLNRALSSADRYMNIEFADDETMIDPPQLSIQDMKFSIVQPNFVELLRDKIKKYSNNADLNIL